MIIRKTWSAALTGAALLAAAVFGGSAIAQSQPSAEAVETARQIISLKGGENIFNTLIPGVIEQSKYMFEQQNPNLGNALREVATKLRNELAPRQAELNSEVAKVYASRFTEKEIKDLLAFYQSPLGRKLITEEPRALDQSMTYAQDWARKLSDEVVVKMRAEMKKLGHDI
jgi:uncharacterized protein